MVTHTWQSQDACALSRYCEPCKQNSWSQARNSQTNRPFLTASGVGIRSPTWTIAVSWEKVSHTHTQHTYTTHTHTHTHTHTQVNCCHSSPSLILIASWSSPLRWTDSPLTKPPFNALTKLDQMSWPKIISVDGQWTNAYPLELMK